MLEESIKLSCDNTAGQIYSKIFTLEDLRAKDQIFVKFLVAFHFRLEMSILSDFVVVHLAQHLVFLFQLLVKSLYLYDFFAEAGDYVRFVRHEMKMLYKTYKSTYFWLN